MCYKTTASGLDILMDVWPPSVTRTQQWESSTSERVSSPAFVYFHGGGLAAGNRHNFTPRWLFGKSFHEIETDYWPFLPLPIERLTNLGYIFISADYRLLPASNGHDILEDILDLWRFITDPDLMLHLAIGEEEGTGVLRTTKGFSIKTDSIAVGGTSAGGLCAYLAATHCKSPKPRALLNIYSMGGEILVSSLDKFFSVT
jgi:acetyl esterase/lipase